MDPNGTWTLYMADAVSSGSAATLNSWSMNVTVVPEPHVAVLALAGLGLAFWRRRWAWRDATGQ